MRAPDFSIFLERREREREIVSSSRFRTFISLFEKEIFPDNKLNDYTNVVPFRIPSYRNHRVVEIFIPTDFSRMVERPVIRRV